MSTRIQLIVPWVGVISMTAPTAIVERLGNKQGLEAKNVRAHLDGIDIELSSEKVTYRPNPAGGLSWKEFFRRLTGELLGDQTPPLQLSLSGALLDGVQQRWHAERLKARAGRRRGRPRRSDRWDDRREEMYARILQRRQEHQESIDDAISSSAQLYPAEFRTAFGGEATPRRIQAVRKYVMRHARDGAIPVENPKR